MKILRRHRGFTTNSSSASEWIDPERPPASIPLDQFDADGNRILPTPTPESGSGDGGPATISLEGFEFNPFATPSPSPSPKPEATAAPVPVEEELPSVASENTAMVLGFLGAILGIFALERMLRLWWRKRKEQED